MDSPQATGTPSAIDDRVFFGPLQSPEKKFALSLSGPKFRTPVRRSTRLSSAMVPLPLFSEEQDSGPSTTREGTPEEDTIPDEPSIILASRVLSACSNPSPPPSPPLLAKNPSSEPDDAQPFDLLDSSQPSNALPFSMDGPLIPLDDLAEPIPTSSPFLPRVSTPTQQHTCQANTSQPDLIAFDSFSTPNASHINALPTSTPSRDTPTQPSTSSVDDLFAISPEPSQPIAHAQRTGASEHLERTGPAATSCEGMEVVTSFVVGAQRSPSALPLEQIASLVKGAAREPASSAEVTPPPSREETLPLRRSSRPRKSRSSLPQTIVNTSPQPAFSSQQSTDPEGSVAEQSDEQRNTQRKRKLRSSPKSEDKIEGIGADAFISPRRLPQVVRAQRELGSLSPMSTAVLSQLFANVAAGSLSGSSTQLPPQDDGAPRPEGVRAPTPSTPPQQTPAFIFPKLGPNEDPAPGAQRPRSPLRPFSPSKFGEGSRTPARRVPIAQAVAEGTYSPNKLPAAFGAPRLTTTPGSPVFKKVALDDPLRSPAKRVPMSEAVPVPPPSPGKTLDKGKGRAIPRLQSPVRASSVPPRDRERSTSVEPQPFRKRERGASAEPTSRPPALGRRPQFQKPASSDGVPGAASKPHSGLPFPFVPGQQQRVPSIPEGYEPVSSPTRPIPRVAVGTGSRGTSAAVASPAKQGSSLRQPSAGAGSKIPRIGAKPYARPRSGTSAEAPSKFPLLTKGSLTSSKTKPLRIVQVRSSSESSSDEGPATSNSVIPAPALKPRRALGVQSSSSSVEAAPATGSKRKREAEPSNAKPAAPAPQPKLVMRKVVPGMFNKGKEPASATPAAEQTTPIPPSPMKVPGPIKARSAVGWKRPQQEPVQLQPPLPAVVSVRTPAPPIAPKECSPELIPSAAISTMNAEPVIPIPVIEPVAPTPAPPEVITEITPAVPPPVSPPSAEPTAEPAVRQPTTRRSTRPRRGTTAASIDVFGSVAATRTTQRRRGPLPSETSGPFAGMTALALKTLTSANTTRNQQQVATIQTEVVRKEGNRPDSPTTRVRSSLEQQKEMRQERAERRARRSAGSDPEPEPGTEGGVVDGDEAANEAEVNADDVSAMSVDEEGLPLKHHRRGPGDEEDYETPPRPERPIKRLRLDGTEDGEDEGENARDVLTKRVKWDKGLHTTVFLDDAPPNPKWDTNAVPSSKSCLTPAAKALRLDTLGNVLNAEIPVSGLIKENIIVKKFVFDDDEQPEEVAPPPTPTAKSTRSKSRKAKS
ncbi:hypothetical protein GSI_13677 [Ganoderma sinense ZZ0214-1]|uniref:Uncharacterized protein n=1 Tax=Ganoderma sinense ZZ0214-1 TaxID=1077348 RepID=A0A2G8RQY4_9APHY|nr:hypothetical protein GSI_13677 [Ganoderma sinense ZZ0214-1]